MTREKSKILLQLISEDILKNQILKYTTYLQF